MRDDKIIAEADGLFKLNHLNHIVITYDNYMSGLAHSIFVASFNTMAVHDSLIIDYNHNSCR